MGDRAKDEEDEEEAEVAAEEEELPTLSRECWSNTSWFVPRNGRCRLSLRKHGAHLHCVGLTRSR
jgi:hypothetical protein